MEALAWRVGLDPFAVDHELRDGTLARVLHHFVRGAGRALDVDLFVGDLVLVEEALGFAAIRAPGACVNGQFHCDYDSKTGCRDSEALMRPQPQPLVEKTPAGC